MTKGLQKDKGTLDYHVPAVFNESRPPIDYTHVAHNMVVEDHPIAFRLPKPFQSKYPSIVGDPDEFTDLIRGPESPTKLDDYLFSDRPVLGLYIVTFNNATIISFHWPHVAFDAMAKGAIMNAWTLLLQGKEDLIPTPIGFDYDPFEDLGKRPSQPHKLVDRRLFTPGILTWALRNISDLAFRKKENRVVYVPCEFLESLHKHASRELMSEDEGGHKVPWVSHGDVLCAWWTRLATSHLPPSSKKTVAIQNACNFRSAVEKDYLSAEGPYIFNCLGFINVLVATRDVRNRSLGWLASQFRRSINEQSNKEQVEAYCAMERETGNNKLPPMFGDTSMKFIAYTNWGKARLFDLDFSAALVEQRENNREPCRPTYIQFTEGPGKFIEGFITTGKDKHGNYWMCGHRVKGYWAKIEKELSMLAEPC